MPSVHEKYHFTTHKRDVNENNQDSIFHLSDCFNNEEVLITCDVTVEEERVPFSLLVNILIAPIFIEN